MTRPRLQRELLTRVFTDQPGFPAVKDIVARVQDGKLDTELVFNSPLHVKTIGQLADWHKDKIFTYGGRRGDGNPLFAEGKCAMLINSSAYYSGLRKSTAFDFGTSELPYWSDVAAAPQNSIIGGATLWVLKGHDAKDYKGVAQFMH